MCWSTNSRSPEVVRATLVSSLVFQLFLCSCFPHTHVHMLCPWFGFSHGSRSGSDISSLVAYHPHKLLFVSLNSVLCLCIYYGWNGLRHKLYHFLMAALSKYYRMGSQKKQSLSPLWTVEEGLHLLPRHKVSAICWTGTGCKLRNTQNSVITPVYSDSSIFYSENREKK